MPIEKSLGDAVRGGVGTGILTLHQGMYLWTNRRNAAIGNQYFNLDVVAQLDLIIAVPRGLAAT